MNVKMDSIRQLCFRLCKRRTKHRTSLGWETWYNSVLKKCNFAANTLNNNESELRLMYKFLILYA